MCKELLINALSRHIRNNNARIPYRVEIAARVVHNKLAVQDYRETLRTEATKSVNTPEQVRVEEDLSGLPVTVMITRRQAIAAIEDKWRVDNEWWW